MIVRQGRQCVPAHYPLFPNLPHLTLQLPATPPSCALVFVLPHRNIIRSTPPPLVFYHYRLLPLACNPHCIAHPHACTPQPCCLPKHLCHLHGPCLPPCTTYTAVTCLIYYLFYMYRLLPGCGVVRRFLAAATVVTAVARLYLHIVISARDSHITTACHPLYPRLVADSHPRHLQLQFPLYYPVLPTDLHLCSCSVALTPLPQTHCLAFPTDPSTRDILPFPCALFLHTYHRVPSTGWFTTILP